MASPTGYAPNMFAQGAQADALRGYSANPFAGDTAGPQSTNMSAHLSQPNPIDPDIVAAYKQLATDPQAKQYNQTGMDLDRIWRVTPGAAIFKPGYKFNPYALQIAEELRQKRNAPQMAEGVQSMVDDSGRTLYYRQDDEGGRYLTDISGNRLQKDDGGGD